MSRLEPTTDNSNNNKKPSDNTAAAQAKAQQEANATRDLLKALADAAQSSKQLADSGVLPKMSIGNNGGEVKNQPPGGKDSGHGSGDVQRNVGTGIGEAVGKNMLQDKVAGTSEVHDANGTTVKDDATGMVVQRTYPDGSVRTFDRDSHGNLQAIHNPDGSSWTNNNGNWTHYDKNGNAMESAGYAPKVMPDGSFSVAEADGTTYNIKADGSSETKRGDGSTVEANAHGDVTSVTYPGGSKRTFTYDANHNLSSFVDTNGKTYSNQGGQWTLPDGSTTTKPVTVDGSGNLEIATSDSSAKKYLTNGAVLTLDQNQVTHVQYANGKGKDIPQGVTADANGNYTIKNNDGTSQLFKSDGSVVHSNKNNQVDEIDYANGEKRQFKYDKKGSLVAMLDSNGTITASDKSGNWKTFNKNNIFDIKDANQVVQVFGDGTIREWNGGDVLTSTANVTSSPQPGHNLWGQHSDNPMAAITPAAVHQGDLGDCYFLAAIAGTAKENPQLIKNMIHDNGNGTYTVTFPGDPKHPVTVNTPTEQELGKYAHDDGQNGTWVNILEKAHRQYTGRETNDDGAQVDTGLKLLTPQGEHTHKDDLTSWSTNGTWAPWDWSIGGTSKGDVQKHIEQALANHEVVTASTGDSGWLDHLGTSNDPGKYVGDHVYAITGYDQKTQTVTVQNPWGEGKGDDGTFTISLNDFMNHFSDLAYQSNS